MLHFIPSWYAGRAGWQAPDARWYTKIKAYEFDDTVNQIRMFRAAGEETTLILLGYMPNLHYFLHRQNLYPMQVWSAFDTLQNVQLQTFGMLSYKRLPWPTGTEWVRTPYAAVAYVAGIKYARVDFGEDGNMVSVEYYLDGSIIARRDLYDDRAFLSSSQIFEEGKVVRREYYDLYGRRRFYEDWDTGAIYVDAAAELGLVQQEYENMGALIFEVLCKYMQTIPAEDTVILASRAQHNQLVMGALNGQKLVLSYFENRYDLADTEGIARDVAQASLVITDTERIARVVRDNNPTGVSVTDISPFDTRLILGQSAKMKQLKIYMPIDDFEQQYLELAMQQILEYMWQNQNVHLTLGVRSDREEAAAAARTLVNGLCSKFGFADMKRVEVVRYVTETDLIRILEDTRLVVDVRDQPDLYLQIAGISAGIPQVNYRFTRYIEHQHDGYIIQNIYHVKEALEYYLTGLSHWNEALVFCVHVAQEYAGGAQVRKWKELLEQNG